MEVDMARKKEMRASPAVKSRRATKKRGTPRVASESRGTTRPETRAISRSSQEHAQAKREESDARGAQKEAREKTRRPAATGAMRQPFPPFPQQEQPPHPGLEAEMTPRPRYEAPLYRAAGKLEGRTALITGGDSGIGRAVAVLFAREGADVALVHLPDEEIDAAETRDAIEAEGRRALLLPGDVTDPGFCADAVERTVGELGRLDILVNNAAFQQHQESIADISDEQWDLTFRTNVYGYFYMAKAALPHLKPGSAIFNTGSVTGLEGSRQLLD
jgi:hypothetical protein